MQVAKPSTARTDPRINAWAPDVVVLAGYMRILSPAFVAHYSEQF
ncbi:formyltransferase family protein [Shigella flexneri]